MQGIKYHSPKRHKKSLKHARLLVLQRFYFLRTVKDGIILCFKRIYNHSTRFLQKCANRNSNPFLPSGERNAPEDKHSFIVRGMFFVFCIHLFHRFYKISGSLTVDYQEKCLQPLIFLHFLCRFICFILLHFIAMYGII